ncbi:MAG: hypothetical protein GX483_08830 [Actinomycetaceae bacterium]|nr:hypothetical protein [Actinomycetaceae bacterium]
MSVQHGSSQGESSDPEVKPEVVPEVAPRRRKRRVVMLSRVDRERLARGEIATPEEAVHRFDAGPVNPVHPDRKTGDVKSGDTGTARKPSSELRRSQLSARDKEILAERPPHFGKL